MFWGLHYWLDEIISYIDNFFLQKIIKQCYQYLRLDTCTHKTLIRIPMKPSDSNSELIINNVFNPFQYQSGFFSQRSSDNNKNLFIIWWLYKYLFEQSSVELYNKWTVVTPHDHIQVHQQLLLFLLVDRGTNSLFWKKWQDWMVNNWSIQQSTNSSILLVLHLMA